MGKTSKKGRITGGQRKEINQRAVDSALADELEGTVFGRVLRHLGAGNVQVMLENQREAIARIRTVLARRGSTPIVADDIVILSGRDFESGDKMRYDLLGVMTRAEAARLEKAGRIPSWFLHTVDGDVKKDEEDIFDYSEAKEEKDEDIDVDAI